MNTISRHSSLSTMVNGRAPVMGGLVAIACFAACAGATADVELNAAQTTLQQARSQRAADCATELFQSAEAALAAARRLNQDGEAEAAKRNAAEAQTLAEQAIAQSPPGCDKPPPEEPPPPPPPPTDVGRDLTLGEVARTIYFDYNDATIRDESREVLSRVAQVLLNAPGERLEVEGHCDVRGSTEYNLHLGERRAQAVMRYLVKQGVDADQVSIISYGEERPVDLGVSEAAHQRNRRAELRPL